VFKHYLKCVLWFQVLACHFFVSVVFLQTFNFYSFFKELFSNSFESITVSQTAAVQFVVVLLGCQETINHCFVHYFLSAFRFLQHHMEAFNVIHYVVFAVFLAQIHLYVHQN